MWDRSFFYGATGEDKPIRLWQMPSELVFDVLKQVPKRFADATPTPIYHQKIKDLYEIGLSFMELLARISQ